MSVAAQARVQKHTRRQRRANRSRRRHCAMQPAETRMILIVGADVRLMEWAALSLFRAGHIPGAGAVVLAARDQRHGAGARTAGTISSASGCSAGATRSCGSKVRRPTPTRWCAARAPAACASTTTWTTPIRRVDDLVVVTSPTSAKSTRSPRSSTTPRLRLRPPHAGDAQAIFDRYACDPRVTRYLGWPTHRTVADTEGFLAFCAAEWARWPAGPFLIESRADGALLGSTGLGFETPQQAATGYVLAHDAWGFGYATEALTAMRERAAQPRGRAGLRALPSRSTAPRRACSRSAAFSAKARCAATRSSPTSRRASRPTCSATRCGIRNCDDRTSVLLASGAMRRVFGIVAAALLAVPATASATWSVIAVDRSTGRRRDRVGDVRRSRRSVPARRPGRRRARQGCGGVPGRRRRHAQNQMLVFGELQKGTDPEGDHRDAQRAIRRFRAGSSAFSICRAAAPGTRA